MERYTGWQYLLIDVANAYGLDKKLFPERIKWAEDNLNNLEALVDDVKRKEQPLYIKAVMAIRRVQSGLPSGDLVSLDACCSGIQVMSAMTGCLTGATNTGLVDPTVRADAYGILRYKMIDLLGNNVAVTRDDAKDALMKMFYGSSAEPKKIFGEDTPELGAFYKSAQIIAPGAWEVLQELLAAWKPWALLHQWKLPDGYDAVVKVMTEKSARIKVAELADASFTYEFKVNEGQKKGISLPANVVHSVDAYVLRCIQRQCNYDPVIAGRALGLIEGEMNLRTAGEYTIVVEANKTGYYVDQFQRSNMADVVIIPYLTVSSVSQLSDDHLARLKDILISMLSHKPFAVLTVHDEFKCHANYMNYLRQHYINVFAEIAESDILSDILSQLYGTKGKIAKLSPNLGELIRGSNYALS